MDEKHNTSLERGAANDIVRLRWRIKICENVIARLQAENERLRLTEAEREAIEGSIFGFVESDPVDAYMADTLRNLLARLS
jgi:hypothetical protein